MKVSEKTIQALLLDYTMQSAQHRIALPNVTDNGAIRLVDWETDLLSVNKSGFSNEYEIKLSRADYMKDRVKERKLAELSKVYENSKVSKRSQLPGYTPNYFWYVTYGFEIDPPPYAGWISVKEYELRDQYYLKLEVKKKAPRLHNGVVDEQRIAAMGKLLSYRLSHAYRALYQYREYKEKQTEQGRVDIAVAPI